MYLSIGITFKWDSLHVDLQKYARKTHENTETLLSRPIDSVVF